MALTCQVTYNHFFRYVFYVLNIIVVVITVAFFIIGFVNFEKYNSISLGSFIGGWVTSISVFYFCIGMIGLIGTRYSIVSLLSIYAGTNTISLVIRILTIIIFSAKKYKVPWYYYAVGVGELGTTIICGSILMAALDNVQSTTTTRTSRVTSKGRSATGSVEEGTSDDSTAYGTNKKKASPSVY